MYSKKRLQTKFQANFNKIKKDICKICDSQSRDKSVICIVESPRDVTTFEKTRETVGKQDRQEAAKAETASFEDVELPADAVKVKAYIWKALGSIKPLGKTVIADKTLAE